MLAVKLIPREVRDPAAEAHGAIDARPRSETGLAIFVGLLLVAAIVLGLALYRRFIPRGAATEAWRNGLGG